MADTDELRAQLEGLGQRREAARATIRETSEQIPELARRAHDAGMRKIEIARLAGISRPALDAMLDGRPVR
jgi:hypothetical protein